MSFLKKPSLSLVSSYVGKSRAGVQFQYSFTGDTPGPIFMAGNVGVGSQFSFSCGSAGFDRLKSSPRTLNFTATFFDPSDTSNPTDGSFLVYVPDTGFIARFNSPSLNSAQAGFVSAQIPIVANTSSAIYFIKEVAYSNNLLYGIVTGTIFDFDMPSYITSGVCNQV